MFLLLNYTNSLYFFVLLITFANILSFSFYWRLPFRSFSVLLLIFSDFASKWLLIYFNSLLRFILPLILCFSSLLPASTFLPFFSVSFLLPRTHFLLLSPDPHPFPHYVSIIYSFGISRGKYLGFSHSLHNQAEHALYLQLVRCRADLWRYTKRKAEKW